MRSIALIVLLVLLALSAAPCAAAGAPASAVPPVLSTPDGPPPEDHGLGEMVRPIDPESDRADYMLDLAQRWVFSTVAERDHMAHVVGLVHRAVVVCRAPRLAFDDPDSAESLRLFMGANGPEAFRAGGRAFDAERDRSGACRRVTTEYDGVVHPLDRGAR